MTKEQRQYDRAKTAYQSIQQMELKHLHAKKKKKKKKKKERKVKKREREREIKTQTLYPSQKLTENGSET